MKLFLLGQTLGICRLPEDSTMLDWATKSRFFTISRTHDELSIVCEQKDIPDGMQVEKDWKVLKVQGPLDFGLTGILASINTSQSLQRFM